MKQVSKEKVSLQQFQTKFQHSNNSPQRLQVIVGGNDDDGSGTTVYRFLDSLDED